MNVIELMILLNKFVFVYFENIGTIVEKFYETLSLRILMRGPVSKRLTWSTLKWPNNDLTWQTWRN